MDMFGASTGARACWLVISDKIRTNGVRAREMPRAVGRVARGPADVGRPATEIRTTDTSRCAHAEAAA